MQKELFYVAASRGRQSVTVITSDKERLRTTVARSMARMSASDLVGYQRRRSATSAVEIVLRQTMIISWNQFVYAEGGADEVRIAFASHDAAVKGSGLGPLLRATAANRVSLIRESERSQRFPDPAGRFVREIVVRRIEAEYGADVSEKEDRGGE
jgi:hypothetical protein